MESSFTNHKYIQKNWEIKKSTSLKLQTSATFGTMMIILMRKLYKGLFKNMPMNIIISSILCLLKKRRGSQVSSLISLFSLKRLFLKNFLTPLLMKM